MIEGTPQPQPNFQGEPQEFRTPEEIMVTLLAQTIIIMLAQQHPTQQMLPMQEQRPSEETAKEANKEEGKKTEFKESPRAKFKTAEKEANHNVALSVITRGEKAPTSEQVVMRPHEMMSKMLQKKAEAPKQGHNRENLSASQKITSLSHRAMENTQAQKPLMPVPPNGERFRQEGNRILEEQGTSRRAMPQGPKQTNHSSDHIFERKVDKDKEENPQKKKRELKGKKVGGTEAVTNKVQRVAAKQFTPPPKDDYEKFLRTMMQDSDLSDFFGRRVSHFDVMLLFIELMKLEVEDNHQDRKARLEERRYQIEWMEGVVKQYKSQANFLLFAGVGAGVLGVLSGALPIVGHVGGDFMLDKLKMIAPSFAEMGRTKAFDNLSKMCFSMAEMNKAMGQVQSSFCDGERSWAEHKSSLHRTDGEESTRVIEERTREFKNWNDVLAQFLRMEQDLVRQLYNG